MAFHTIPDRNSQLAPKFWRNETSGQLEFAVRAYLDNPQTMTPNEIAYMRAYLGQWIASPVWDMNPAHTAATHAALMALRGDVGRIMNGLDIGRWLRDALDAGIDPL